MSRRTRRLLGVFLGAMGCAVSIASAVAETKPSDAARATHVMVAEVRGVIDPAIGSYLQNAVKRAQAEGAAALVIEMDTPGGLLSSTREIAQTIDQSTVPVVVYVTPAGASATSAGALLMLASHVAAMTPGSNVGAAHPVGPQGEDVKGAMGEKVLNDTVAFAKSLAGLRGRSQKLAEEVVAKSRSFTADEARKEGLIEIVADSRGDLLRALDGRKVKVRDRELTLATRGAVARTLEMSWGEKLLHLIAHPNIAAILMTLGMLLIYVEVSNPGVTIAGILGGICLVLAFMSFQALPIRAGGAILLLLGMILMILEPFVGSGGVLAGGGVLAFVLGLLWVIDPSETNVRIDTGVIVMLTVTLGSGAAIIGFAAARMKRLSRETLARIGGSGAVGLVGYEGRVQTVHADGRSGQALFRGEVWSFVSDSSVEVGDAVWALRADGFKIHVRKDGA